MGATARQAEGGPVTNVLSEEPPRPRPSQDLLRFFPALKEYKDRIEWADERIQELSSAKLDAERAQTSAQGKVTELTAKLQTQTDQLNDLRSQQTVHTHSMQQDMEEKEKWFNGKLDLLAKREQEVKAAEVNTERPKAGLKADQSLFDAIENLGKAMEKARREMSNLVAGKKRPEQAFAKWENAYCKPALEVVHLTKKVKDDRDRHQQEHSEQLGLLVQREEKTKLMEEHANVVREKRDRELKLDQQLLMKEKEDWRFKCAQKLEGEELEAVQKVWFEVHEQQVRTKIWEETKADNYRIAEMHIQERYDAQYAKARHEGSKEGYEDGVREGCIQGRRDALTDLAAKLAHARAEGYEEGSQVDMAERAEDRKAAYNEGLEDGKEQGRVTGRDEGRVESDKARGEAFYRAFRWGIKMPEWVEPRKLKEDGTANLKHPYWWGRATARFVKGHGL